MSVLFLAVGSLLQHTPDESPGEYEDERERLTDMMAWLAEEGVEMDLLADPGRQVWEGEIADFAHIYHLRVLAAHVGAGRDIGKLKLARLQRTEEPDPLLSEIWQGDVTSPYDHLINHSLTDGFYLPVDFESPIWAQGSDDGDEESIVSFGSAVALERELRELKAALDAEHLSARHPAYVALLTFEAAARNSVAHRLPVSIWE
jgi:hypothetical protein